MDAALRRRVRRRAGDRCEYCHLRAAHSPLVLQIEHVIPRKHRGVDAFDNLALACDRCNLHKGTNLSGIDPDTGQLTPLFNPRGQCWSDHFAFVGAELIGQTAIGRVTIGVLENERAATCATSAYAAPHGS